MAFTIHPVIFSLAPFSSKWPYSLFLDQQQITSTSNYVKLNQKKLHKIHNEIFIHELSQ